MRREAGRARGACLFLYLFDSSHVIQLEGHQCLTKKGSGQHDPQSFCGEDNARIAT